MTFPAQTSLPKINFRRNDLNLLQSLTDCARWISKVTNPPFLTALALIAVAGWSKTTWGWIEAIGYGLIALVLPTLYIVLLVREGKVTDLHLNVREQRTRPYLFAIICMAIGYTLLTQFDTPLRLLQLARINLLQTVLLMLITFRWKISTHTTSAVGICVWLCHVLGPSMWPLLLVVPWVAWSRLYLRRHDLGQVIGGVCLGASTTALLLLF